MNTNQPVGENSPPLESTAPKKSVEKKRPERTTAMEQKKDAAKNSRDAQEGTQQARMPHELPAGVTSSAVQGNPAETAPSVQTQQAPGYGLQNAPPQAAGSYANTQAAPGGYAPQPGQPITGWGYGYSPTMPAAPKDPFTATKVDGLFAIAGMVLGFLFVRWMLFGGLQGWGVTLFTVLFAGCTLAYAAAKKIRPPKESWFWLGILLLTGGAYALWPAGSMAGLQALLLFGSAFYWCGSLFGSLLAGKTSNYSGLDVINLIFVVPFRNFITAFYGLKALIKGKNNDKTENKIGEKSEKKHAIWYVLVGLAVCIPLVAILLSQLLVADGGNFRHLMQGVADFLNAIFQDWWYIYLWQIVLGVPVALFICGLVMGCAHKRYVANFDIKKTQKGVEAMRLVPLTTLATILLVVSALYVVFVGCQIPYFFSAFAGVRPQGYEIYSDYARDGFFELCRIAAINLALLTTSNILSRRARAASLLLRMANIVLSVLTLLLIATAFSKMALYISACGLTPKRIMTSVFMLFLAGVFVAVIVLQFRQFSILRFAAVYGAVLFCGLCLINIDGLSMRDNARRYLDKEFSSFDGLVEQVVYSNGTTNGTLSMLDVYMAERDMDIDQKQLLRWGIENGYEEAERSKNTSRDTLLYAQIRKDQRLPADWEAL